MKIGKFILAAVLLTSAAYPQLKYGSELLANLAQPIGKYSKYFNTGFGVTGGFFYDIEDNVRIGLSIGYVRNSVDESEIEKYFIEAYNNEGSLSISGYSASLPINIMLKLITPGESQRFYGSFEGGLTTIWIKSSGNFTYSGGTVPVEKDEFRSEAAITVGLGTLFRLEETLWLDINVKYQFIEDSEYIQTGPDQETISTGKILLFGAGVNWTFEVK